MNLKQLANLFDKELTGIYEEDEVKAIFGLLIKNRLNYNRADLILKKEIEVTVDDIDFITSVLQQLKYLNPIQYILGETEFYGLKFKVTPSVLIPRPETEELVEWILSDKKSANNLGVLDIGTGSGCIAIALKKNHQDWKITGLDISMDSLSIAKKNALLNDVEVDFMQDDILNPALRSATLKYDIIVSNPPYITESEKLEMHDNVLANEPYKALFVSNEKPLIFYEAIADFALQHLATNGFLYFEINEYLAKETINMLIVKGFVNIELKKDMQGKDRMLRCNF
jgi:release factor glutamine methyltransferase